MTGPYLHVGLHDPDRDTATLRDATSTYLLIAGADVEPDGGRHRVGPGTALTGDDRGAWLEELPPGDGAEGAGSGGLVQLVVELGELEFEPPAAWRDLLLAALDVAAGVRPLIATVAVEEPPDALPDPDWRAAAGLLAAGWVDVPRLSSVRRLRFERLESSGLAVPYAGGLAWGLTAVLHPGDAGRVAGIAPWVAAAAAYEAWTGRAADPQPDVPPPDADDDPAAPVPQVWWWSQGEDPEAVRARVADAVTAPVEARVDRSGDPGWQAVVADLGSGEAAAALDLLRGSVAAVKPSWAAVQPSGGLAVPGMDPDLPMTGVLVNPWVSRAWAGDDDIAGLDHVLGGAHREEVADGVLWVTDPRLADVPDPSWADDDTRWDRLVEAADLLGRIARREP
jgi:hypothetical protein